MPQSLRPVISSKRELSDNEEKVLGLLHHLRGIKQTWEAKVSAEGDVKELQEKIEAIEKQIQDLTNNSQEKPLSTGEAFKQSKAILLAGGAAACFGLGIATNANTSLKQAAPWLYLIGAGSGIAAAARTRGSYKKSQLAFEQSSQAMATLKEDLTQNRRLYSETSKKFRDNNIELPRLTLGKAFLPVQTTKALNRSFLTTTEDIIKPAKLQSVYLQDLSEESENILAMTKKLDLVPVLLAPDQESITESRDSNSALHGEERNLKDAVSQYVKTLGSIQDETLNLPAIRPESNLGRALRAVIEKNPQLSKITTDESIALRFGERQESAKDNLNRFEKLHEDTEKASKTAIPQLEEVNGELRKLCNRYRYARTNSTNELHLNYQKVLSRANWSSKRFYCPRTILSKEYLQSLIQLDFDEAHNASPEELVDALQSDSYINSRISSKPQLIDELIQSHQAIHELINSYDLNPDSKGIVRVGAAAEHIVDQLKQELGLFRQRLTEALTGSPNGFLGISESARLYFDPERDIWSSPVLPYSYTTSEAEQYGQVMRTDVDLLIPLWEHLWTEKADFRKSELFRTNESILRMSEKEGEKIKQIGYQFQADLREVRSNMFLAKADFDAKLQELSDYEDTVQELGLMDAQQKEKLKSSTNELQETSNETTGDSEGYELILLQEPGNQLLRRQSGVSDPIDVIKSPDLLIQGGTEKGIRRLNYVADSEEAGA